MRTETSGRNHHQLGDSDFFGLCGHNQGGWLSIGNLQSISQVTAVLGIIAFGEALVIATGEIDISVGSVSGIGALTFLGLAPTVGSGLALWSLRSHAGYLSAH